MTHTPSPAVIEEDREAAAALADVFWNKANGDYYRSGRGDAHTGAPYGLVQAFAAHRELGERRAEAAHHRHLVADPIDPSLEGNPGCA